MTDLEARWSVFRTGLLRSAGFPFEWLDDLASQALEDLSTLLVDAHERREAVRAGTQRALWSMRRDTPRADMPMLNRAITRVRSRKAVTEPQAAISAATGEWNAEVAHFDSVCAQLSPMLQAEHEREQGLLLSHVTSDYFMDAVLLSSPSAYQEFCRTSDSKRFHRGHELVAYRFLQRFCGKNETGGTIGPLNLITAGTPRDGTAANPGKMQYIDDPVLGRVEYIADGDGRSAERLTFLSHWAAGEIGRSLIQNVADARYACQPYRILTAAKPELPEADARLLSRIDGQMSLSALAAELGLTAGAVDAAVSRLAGLGLVEDSWQAPYFTGNPGEDLRKLAARIGIPDGGRAGQLLADVERFAQIPLEDRPTLLSAITRNFSELTNKPAWRGAGQILADRTVFFEEAKGNIRAARIDSKGAQRLAECLSTTLEFFASLAIEERAAGQSLLARELARRNVRELPATDVRDLNSEVPETPPDQMTLKERFLRLVDPSAPCAELTRRELTEAGLIREDLGDWPIFGAADLMLTGPGDATEPGSIILSELHHGCPTLASQVRATYSDSELGNQELWQIVARELAPATPTLQEIHRQEKTTDSSPYGHTVLCLDTGMPVPGAATVPADRAVVRRWQNGFIGLHDPASQRDLWLLPEYEDVARLNVGGLVNCSIPALSLTPFTLGSYTPRIIIDGVVIQRRRWEIGTADFPSISGRLPTEREWLALQLWRRARGMPKCMYFLLDTEKKPVYLDFSSVLSVTNFARCLRRAQRAALTEALPDPQRLWLRTKDGTLTSEIRILLWRDRQTRGSASPTGIL